MNHEETVRKVLSSRNAAGALKSRESNTVEFKESLAEVEKIKFTTIIQKLFVIKILANRDAIFFVSSDQNMLLPDFVDTFNGFFVHLKRIS